MEQERIALACDHAGYALKEQVSKYLVEQGYEPLDFGTYSEESCDYPDFAHRAGSAVNKGEVRRGIVVCGSGEGVSMTVNKYPNVRCALAWKTELAKLGRQHNDCNMLALPARFIGEQEAMQCVDAFLHTDFEGGRHQRRVEKISHLLS